jgi:hypothetical protein
MTGNRTVECVIGSAGERRDAVAVFEWRRHRVVCTDLAGADAARIISNRPRVVFIIAERWEEIAPATALAAEIRLVAAEGAVGQVFLECYGGAKDNLAKTVRAIQRRLRSGDCRATPKTFVIEV